MEAADFGGGGSEDDVDEFVAILQLTRLGYIRLLLLMVALIVAEMILITISNSSFCEGRHET